MTTFPRLPVQKLARRRRWVGYRPEVPDRKDCVVRSSIFLILTSAALLWTSSEGLAQGPAIGVEDWIPDSVFSEDAPSPNRIWVDTEVLLWWMSGARVPPLLTSSPPGTPRSSVGVLGAPGTTILFSGNSINEDLRVGGRITAGGWLDEGQNRGLEA